MGWGNNRVEAPESAVLKLLEYCRDNDWSGHDPYDALNSGLFEAWPILNSRIPRLALTQLLKRSPWNARRWLRIPATQNPKALALFLVSALKLSEAGLIADEQLARSMVERLVALRSAGSPYWCWGYSFAWQTRT